MNDILDPKLKLPVKGLHVEDSIPGMMARLTAQPQWGVKTTFHLHHAVTSRNPQIRIEILIFATSPQIRIETSPAQQQDSEPTPSRKVEGRQQETPQGGWHPSLCYK